MDSIIVRGDHLNVTFALDGSLRKVARRWRSVVAIAPLPLSSRTTRDAVVTRALDILSAKALERNLKISASGQVAVGTFFEPVSLVPDQWELRGEMAVPLAGPEGSYKLTKVDFDL